MSLTLPADNETVRQRPSVYHDERLRRPGQRDVELAQPLLAVLGDRGGLDDDDMIELEAFRLARRQDRHEYLVVRVAARRGSHERARRDHGDQPLELRERSGFLQR